MDRGERQGIIGQMRVGAIEMGGRIWAKGFFVDFVVDMMR